MMRCSLLKVLQIKKKTFSQPLSHFPFIPIDYKDIRTKQYVDIQLFTPVCDCPVKTTALNLLLNQPSLSWFQVF